MKVGFVGPGAIGGPMVGRLVAAGHDLRVLARNDGTRRRIERMGAVPVRSLTDVARGSEVVVACVLTDEQVRTVAFGDGGLVASLPRGAVFVVHTTASPTTVRSIGTAAAEQGVVVVDAPVSGTVDDVRAGRITLLVGGTQEATNRCRPVLEAYGDPVLHLGALGSGQAAKLVNNALLAAHAQLAADAVRLAGELGVDPAALAPALTHCSGASWALNALAGVGSVGALAERMGPYLRKDLETVGAAARALGVDLGLLGRTASGGPLAL